MSDNRFKRFDTVSDFIAACEAPTTSQWHTTDRRSRDTSDMQWFGGVSFDGAKRLALYGWEEGLAKIHARIEKTFKDVQGRITIKGVAGSHPDVARFIAGMPDCMSRRVYTEAARKPCLDIVINRGMSGNVTAEQCLNYGIGIASFLDEIENAGYSASLSIGTCTKIDNEGNIALLVDVKRHGEALELGKLIYFMAHPSFLRRLSFSYRETIVTQARHLINNYGVSEAFPENLRGDLYFPHHRGNNALEVCGTLPGALRYVQRVINAQRPDLLNDELAA